MSSIVVQGAPFNPRSPEAITMSPQSRADAAAGTDVAALLGELLRRMSQLEERLEARAKGPDPLLADLADAYVDSLRVGRAPHWIATVERILRRITSDLGIHRLSKLTLESVEAYMARRIAGGLSPRTANMYGSELARMLRWAERVQRIQSNPLRNLKLLRLDDATRKKVRRALTDEEIEAFLIAAARLDAQRDERALAKKTIAGGTKGKGWKGRGRRPGTPTLPLLPLWTFLIESGARFGETIALRWADLDQVQGTITFRPKTVKTRAGRTIPLRGPLRQMLLSLRKRQAKVLGREIGPEDRIFLRPKGTEWRVTGSGPGSPRHFFYEALERAGIPRVDEQGRSVDIHALRGTAASRYCRSGVSIEVVMELCGWRSAEVPRKHYLDFQLGDVKRAISKVPSVRRKRSAP